MGRWLAMVFVAIIFLSGCQTMESTEEKPDLFQRKGSYLGDASAVGSIVKELPSNEAFTGMELQTKEEPYGLTLKYKASLSKEMIVHNASYLFTLIRNVEWITFSQDGADVTVTRQDLEESSGVKFAEIETEDEVKQHIQKIYENRRVMEEMF